MYNKKPNFYLEMIQEICKAIARFRGETVPRDPSSQVLCHKKLPSKFCLNQLKPKKYLVYFFKWEIILKRARWKFLQTRQV